MLEFLCGNLTKYHGDYRNSCIGQPQSIKAEYTQLCAEDNQELCETARYKVYRTVGSFREASPAPCRLRQCENCISYRRFFYRGFVTFGENVTSFSVSRHGE